MDFASVRLHVGPFSWHVLCAPDGRFRIEHLPPGRETLEAYVRVDDRDFEGQAAVETGTYVDVAVQPKGR